MLLQKYSKKDTKKIIRYYNAKYLKFIISTIKNTIKNIIINTSLIFMRGIIENTNKKNINLNIK